MAKMTIYDKKTGEPNECEGVDAREILATSDRYTADTPKAKKNDLDGDGNDGAPQNVANVENEFRREPVGADPVAPERDVTIIRNPVTDTPKMAEDVAKASDKPEDPKADKKK